MRISTSLASTALVSLLAIAGLPQPAAADPPGGVVEGIHGAIPGFPENSCWVCHDIVAGKTGNDGVQYPNQMCLGCHTDGPTYGEDDPLIDDRPHATPVGDHASLVTGSTKFEYGDFGVVWPFVEYEQQIHCTTCHDPHRTFDPNDPDPSTNNIKYIRDHTDDWQLNVRGLVVYFPNKEIRVIDNTGPEPVEIVKLVDQDIVYTGSGDFGDGVGDLALETDVCEVCHTLTDHHQVDGTAPGGNSHFDGEDCTSCHTHPNGFAPSGGQPLTGPHAVFGDPDCGSCHDSTYFPGGVDNPDGLASVFCATCHSPDNLARIHSHTVTGTTQFEYTLECLTCHDQHGWDIHNVDGNDNLDYIKATIDEDITVIDKTQVPPVQVDKTILSAIVFDSQDDFADGDALYERDICVTCHTLTSHHQNDGTAPGGQSHRDGEVCTTCHQHPEGFRPPGGLSGPPVEGPHAAIPGFPGSDCLVCHDLYLTLDEMRENSTEVCLSCHSDAWTIVEATPEHVHSSVVTGSTRFDYNVECVACHAPHGWQAEVENEQGSENIRYVRANVDEMITVVDNTVDPPVTVVKEIDNAVVFTDRTGDGSFADGDANYTEDVCNTCHTLTNHHQNDGTAPGDQSHFDGQACTDCHLHPEGFGGFAGPHVQADSDCANCHLGTDGEPDLTGVHGNDCVACHPTDFSGTILGPLGTWNGECTECHNPFIEETGSMDEPTKGHRCVACHGNQLGTGDIYDIHEEHAEKANCVVCHGFIPDVGTAIGSGNRGICITCHGSPRDGTSIRKIHDKHTGEGLSCLECHGGERPPVDIVDGPPVGRADNVCDLCHNNRDPSRFSEREHEKHTDNKLDCGSCHLEANLQDDRVPMAELDDEVRSMLPRGGFSPCTHCHRGGETGDSEEIHEQHVADQWQWCYTCHLPSDGRPAGDEPPITQPAESCLLCHGLDETYDDDFPFDIHEEHAGKNKCYACHQTEPELFEWPRLWLGGTD
jgi:nitrate/TMAO reductase-like tetraheme cytochrome c subunit